MPQTTRLAILQAEDRRAPTPRDLAIIRAGARSGDAQTARVAVRALGRLERPALIADIAPGAAASAAGVRAEAANAIGQAAQGWKATSAPAAAATLDAALAALAARLKVEADADVRAAICETIGRLPYPTAAQVDSAERTLLEMACAPNRSTDRLGVAKGFEALVRMQRKLQPPASRGASRIAASVWRRRTLAEPPTGAARPAARARSADHRRRRRRRDACARRRTIPTRRSRPPCARAAPRQRDAAARRRRAC